MHHCGETPGIKPEAVKTGLFRAHGLWAVGVAVLGSPSLTVLMVSVSGCKATLEEEEENRFVITKAQQICGRGCGPGLLFPNSPSGLCGREAAMKKTGLCISKCAALAVKPASGSTA